MIIILIIIGILAYIQYYYCYSMATLPKGDYIGESTSPDGKYTLKAYLDSPALSSDCVRGELINNTTGKTKNIYWEYREWRADIYWENDNTAVINGTILNVEKEVYDFRRKG